MAQRLCPFSRPPPLYLTMTVCSTAPLSPGVVADDSDARSTDRRSSLSSFRQEFDRLDETEQLQVLPKLQTGGFGNASPTSQLLLLKPTIWPIHSKPPTPFALFGQKL